MTSVSQALKSLQGALQRTSPRADGNFNASDFMEALQEAINDCEETEWQDSMGDDL